jgi:hypothetical protein
MLFSATILHYLVGVAEATTLRFSAGSQSQHRQLSVNLPDPFASGFFVVSFKNLVVRCSHQKQATFQLMYQTVFLPQTCALDFVQNSESRYLQAENRKKIATHLVEYISATCCPDRLLSM